MVVAFMRAASARSRSGEMVAHRHGRKFSRVSDEVFARIGRTRRVAATDSANDVSGFCTAVTMSPLACKRATTSAQLEPSAQAPCTSTTFFTAAGAAGFDFGSASSAGLLPESKATTSKDAAAEA